MFALYVWRKKHCFPNSDFTHSKIYLTHTNKLTEFKELGSCHKDYWRCTFLYVRFVNVPTLLVYDGLLKAFFLPLALSFSPDRFDQQLLGKKLIWIQVIRDQIKLLGFDSRSNTSSWRLFFKLSVSYSRFWPQNSFSTYQVDISLRILKTLHLVRIC